MKNKLSTISFDEAIHSVMLFSPVKIYYNKKCIWDDLLSIDEGWVRLKDALDNFRSTHKDYNRIVITDIRVEVVEWHHSIIRLKGKVDKVKEKTDD